MSKLYIYEGKALLRSTWRLGCYDKVKPSLANCTINFNLTEHLMGKWYNRDSNSLLGRQSFNLLDGPESTSEEDKLSAGELWFTEYAMEVFIEQNSSIQLRKHWVLTRALKPSRAKFSFLMQIS